MFAWSSNPTQRCLYLIWQCSPCDRGSCCGLYTSVKLHWSQTLNTILGMAFYEERASANSEYDHLYMYLHHVCNDHNEKLSKQLNKTATMCNGRKKCNRIFVFANFTNVEIQWIEMSLNVSCNMVLTELNPDYLKMWLWQTTYWAASYCSWSLLSF